MKSSDHIDFRFTHNKNVFLSIKSIWFLVFTFTLFISFIPSVYAETTDQSILNHNLVTIGNLQNISNSNLLFLTLIGVFIFSIFIILKTDISIHFRFSQKIRQILSSCMISLLIVTVISAPLSLSAIYWPPAYAQGIDIPNTTKLLQNKNKDVIPSNQPNIGTVDSNSTNQCKTVMHEQIVQKKIDGKLRLEKIQVPMKICKDPNIQELDVEKQTSIEKTTIKKQKNKPIV